MSLSYWSRESLRRGWRKLNGYGEGRKQRDQRQERPAIYEAHECSLASKNNENEKRKGEPGDTPSNKIIAAFTGALFVVGLLQWDRIGQQITSSENIASANSKDTQAALAASRRAAAAAEAQSKATERQSLATERALGISQRTAAATADFAKASQVSAEAGREQAQTATRALQDSQTPQVRLWVDDELTNFKEGLTLQTNLNIKNAGRVTLFNGRVSMSYGYAWVAQIPEIWKTLRPRDTVVMGPDDQETFHVYWDRLTPLEHRRIKEGRAVFVVAGKIVFVDTAHRTHNRYICQFWAYDHGNMIPSACSTPPQN